MEPLSYVIDFATARPGSETRLTQVLPVEAKRVVVMGSAEEQLGALIVGASYVSAPKFSAADKAVEVVAQELEAGRVVFLTLQSEMRAMISDRFSDALFEGRLSVPRPPSTFSQAEAHVSAATATVFSDDWPMTRVALDEAVNMFKAVLRNRDAYSSVSSMLLHEVRSVLPEQHVDFNTTRCSETKLNGFMRRFALTAAKQGGVAYNFSGSGRDCVWLTEEAPKAQLDVVAADALPSGPSPRDTIQAIHAGERPIAERMKQVYELGEWGPFTTLRGHLYASLRAPVSAPMPVATLIQRAMTALAEALPKNSTSESGKAIRLPLNAIRTFVWNMLAARPVLVGPDTAAPFPATFPATNISGVVDDLELLLDLAVTNFWFSSGGELRDNEVDEFCRFLLTGAKPDREARMYAMFECLRKEGLLVYVEHKFMCPKAAVNVVELKSKFQRHVS